MTFISVVISETSTSSDTCTDLDPKCADWASRGECQSNPVWMMANCRISCRCQGGDRAWRLRDCIASHYDNPTNSNLSHVVSVESIRINHVDVDKEKQMVGVFGRMVLIWTPQLIQINSTSINPGTTISKVLVANHTDQVYMWLDSSFAAPYNFRYEDYPNDYQHLCFKFDDKQYFSVRFIIADKVKSKKHEEFTETYAIGWTLENVEINVSPTSVVIGNIFMNMNESKFCTHTYTHTG
ncbi:unnamed protein product [Cercopithifilaria johnstoni]|uniref:ShKT domain-containing protein n=1 Tax=Cercopithifilaria johnstoni TaxID=2874296 RepID=A0A8J2MRB6_9BILA|nr:unnamed protein product [Cercopithifilaria johnstoni]